jgi:two-component system, response regulator
MKMIMNKYVLLVEDNADDVLLTQQAFKRGQVPNKVTVVSDGRQALDFLFCPKGQENQNTNEKPGLILLDLNLPLVSGMDVLKEVRAKSDTSRIPVIILTTSSEDRDKAESLRLGANDYICKPTGLFEFVEIVKKIKIQWLD